MQLDVLVHTDALMCWYTADALMQLMHTEEVAVILQSIVPISLFFLFYLLSIYSNSKHSKDVTDAMQYSNSTRKEKKMNSVGMVLAVCVVIVINDHTIK
jgi:uncharacterized membrane protein SpoIIM required for sporulation